ncbi:PilW family protein [Legionella yabuuchiae]|uniref:PilW family protein n=1 Tax=Legionella yabuuchiae TaxID=376727 RepID=UPI0010543056|nr:prepilin-type N-terminal cleavage/methylation domain-containing protein [Legionella yabuuchiae]
MKCHRLGFSLTEVLIGMFISSILVLMVINQFLSVKHHVQYISHAMEQDIELQLVVDLMRHSIRHAGFTPCLNLEHLVTADRTQQNRSLSALNIEQGTSRIRIQRMNESFEMVEVLLSDQTLLTGKAFKTNQLVLIADCYHAEVQKIHRVRTKGDKVMITLEKPFLFNFHEPIYIGHWINEEYLIQRNNHSESLFYKQNHKEELTPLVKSMTISLVTQPVGKIVRIHLEMLNEQNKQFSVRLR